MALSLHALKNLHFAREDASKEIAALNFKLHENLVKWFMETNFIYSRFFLVSGTYPLRILTLNTCCENNWYVFHFPLFYVIN